MTTNKKLELMQHYVFDWRAGCHRGRTGFEAANARDAWNQLRYHVFRCTMGGSKIEYAYLRKYNY